MMERRWMDFISIDVALSPLQLRDLLLENPHLTMDDQLADGITGELYFDFTFKKYKFSMHNPYSGAYGYWFFYYLDAHDPKITAELKELLEMLEKTNQ